MPYFIGIALAPVIALFLRFTRFDRDRAVYPTILIVIPGYYVLFAAMGGSMSAVGIETMVLLGFALVAVLGFASSLWWVVAGLAGHGVLDFFHGGLIANPGVPSFWPAFCGSIDVALAACLAVLLLRGMVEPGGRGARAR